jgi:hypothetical protein
MSLFWMIVIALLIAAEKMLPWRTLATAGVAVVLAALAIGVAAAPAHVPGLTVPDGMGGMDMQGGAMDKGMQGMQDKGMQDKQMHKPAMKKSMDGMGTQSP